MVPPYTAKPNPETLIPMIPATKLYTFIIFDTETTCTGKQAELCQLSAIKESNLRIFSKYILPTTNISPGATRVSKLSVKILTGKDNYKKKTNQLRRCTLLKRYRNFWPSSLVHTRKNLTHF